MHFAATLFSAFTAITAAAASPVASDARTFGLVSIRSGSDLQYGSFSAAKGSFLINLPQGQQNASCDAGHQTNDATFSLTKSGELFLYSTSAPVQEVFVDRSGMAQGIIGYTTGAQPTPKDAERKGWAITNDHLQFDGRDPIACPNSIDGSYSVWIDVGIQNPAYNKDCVGIAARVIDTQNPVGCEYTSS